MSKDTLIFIPTYNESENIELILKQILALGLEADILFVDDNSPDGTGKLLDNFAKKHSNVYIQHRSGKLGIGSAHKQGIAWAYDQGYQNLVTMDCDFTHSPEYILEFLAQKDKGDIVVGSRYLQEGSLSTWNHKRRLLTHSGHFATSFFLGMPYDATGSYRLYRLDRIPKGFLSLVTSNGYSFFFESLFVLNQNKFRVIEIPTSLPARTYGNSKMQTSDAINSLKQLGVLFTKRLFNPGQFKVPAPASQILTKEGLVDPQGWDEYWERKDGNQPHFAYGLIAAFYRKFIIRPSLNKFIQKYFSNTDQILHAGCGSGQVDVDLHRAFKISALDISPAALSLYKKSNPSVKQLIHGSIFEMPIEPESLDGIYNLGVMEHFTEDQIQDILAEYSRVLKPDGRIVLFWPPKFGLSVLFLKLIHYLLNDILKKNIKLHPDEIVHIISKKHAKEILEKKGFILKEYSFGPSDLFTHAILVGQKINRTSLAS